MFSFNISSSIIFSLQFSFLYLSMSHWYILLSNLPICYSITCFWPYHLTGRWLLLNSWVLWWQVIQKKEKISRQKGVGVSPAQGGFYCNLCMRLTKWAAEQEEVCGRSRPMLKNFLKVQAKS